MSIFGSLMDKIVGRSARKSEAKVNAANAASAAAAPPATHVPRPAPTAAPAAAPVLANVDVEEVLEEMAKESSQTLDWRHSIVDLMKLVGIDSHITNRRALANELGYTGDLNDSATMNVWLHKAVLQKMAENGGKVPSNLAD